MNVERRSADGRVVLVRRPLGYAVSRWVVRWQAAGRVYMGAWETVRARLSLSEADSLFVTETGEAGLYAERVS